MCRITVNSSKDSVSAALAVFQKCDLESLNNVRNLHCELFHEIRQTHPSEDLEFVAFCAMLAVWCAGYAHGRAIGPAKKRTAK